MIANFVIRFKTSILIVFFHLFLVCLSLFANKEWMGFLFKNNFQIQAIFPFLFLLCLIPLIFQACKEICFLFFLKKSLMTIITSITCLLFTCLPNIFFICVKYDFLVWKAKFPAYLLYYIFLFLGSLVILISNFGIIFFHQKTKILIPCKNYWQFPILMTLINLFFPLVFYLAIAHCWGVYLILLLISNSSDAFAYIGGAIFGKHKSFSKISPNKTWEGYFFGLCFTILAMLIAYLLLFFVSWKYQPNHSIIYYFIGIQFFQDKKVTCQWYWWFALVIATVLISTISYVGDLFYSLIKRKYKIKDFANLLPGHGGILDRLDALSFVFVFFTIFTIVFQLIFNKNSLSIIWN